MLLDSREEILSLQETAVRTFYGGEVPTVKTSNEALDLINSIGHPELLILESDILKGSNLHFELKKDRFDFPIIGTTVNKTQTETDYPEITAVIEKPINATSFTTLVRSFTNADQSYSEYVPVKITLLSKLGIGHFDLFIKLSETNFVKVSHQGEAFLDSDFIKLSNKGISDLYIRRNDSVEFLKILQSSLPGDTSDDSISLVLEQVETFERIGKFLNWGPEILISARKSVEEAVAILSKNKNLLKVLKKKLSDKSSPYSQHVALQAYLTCAFSSSLGWIGDSAPVKLAMAALLHDANVDEAIYGQINEWNKKASDPSNKEIEILKYRMHPFEAAKLVKTLDTLSTDVEQILVQHHEKKDGSGFPRGLNSSRIGLLPSLFIMVEDMVEFIGDGENLETSLTDYITWGREYYSTGNFEKVFTTFDEKIRGS